MYIGIDIGGTKINSVLFDGKKIVKKRKVLTQSKSNKRILIAQIFDCIEKLMGEEVEGAGIGIAGPIDFKTQKILNPPNLKALAGCNLVDLIQNKFKIKAVIDNDSNCFGLAEAILGVGENSKLLIGFTLGTGVGGAIVVNKKIFHGAFGSAGELGHMIIQQGGRKCSCGNKGCLEPYINGRGIMKTAKELKVRGRDPREIEDMAREGNKKAIKVYRITGEYLGIGLASVANTLNPDIIVIGGGIAHSGELILKSARKIMQKNILSPMAKKVKLTNSKLGKDAGAMGAALLFTDYPQ